MANENSNGLIGKDSNNFKDRTGKRNGRLMVVRFVKWAEEPRSDGGRNSIWLCRCDCDGREIEVKASRLHQNGTRSCGCLKAERPNGGGNGLTGKSREESVRFKDRTGQRFGSLLVLKLIGWDEKSNGTSTNSRWLCRCEAEGCGKEVEYNSTRLATRKSCGCQNTRDKGNGFSLTHYSERTKSLNQVYSNNKHSAKTRGIDWALSKEQAFAIYKSPCHYGTGPAHTPPPGHFVGIDRKDNSIGYVPGNCLPCCRMCNNAKKDQTTEQFLAWVSSFSQGANS